MAWPGFPEAAGWVYAAGESTNWSIVECEVDASRDRVLTGRPLEDRIGFCRAMRLGNRTEVSGTAPTNPDGSTAGGSSAYGQTRACLEIIEGAIEELGGSLEDVYRTRMFIVRTEDWEEVGRAHGEFFREIKPAATMVTIAELLNPEWLVEIEAYAQLDE